MVNVLVIVVVTITCFGFSALIGRTVATGKPQADERCQSHGEPGILPIHRIIPLRLMILTIAPLFPPHRIAIGRYVEYVSRLLLFVAGTATSDSVGL
jgi:hypothetical protein